ncbi:HD-like signal output (HDOD) domain, no enzymatic activity [Verrucomicrobium sp. GAS474]|nr:HD-like signal output (HDOD) domain, no enzymatic activity [Verrucomicrobium sp. GAS474]
MPAEDPTQTPPAPSLPSEAASVTVAYQLPGRAASPQQQLFRDCFLDLMESEEAILPSAASPLGRLWQLIRSPDSTLDECAEVIALDPALTARVFRIANSPLYGGTSSTTKEAVLQFGYARLRQFVFSAQIIERFSKMEMPPGWEHFWIRNVFSAQFVERIAGKYFKTTGSEYLAGMLHDTGWLMLASFFPDEFRAVLESPNEVPLEQAEKEVFSFSHADASSLICAKSHLPARVVNAVAAHHHPLSLPDAATLKKPEESETLLAVLLFLCDRLADDISLPIGGRSTGLAPEEVLSGPEWDWLDRYGKKPEFRAIAEEELDRAYQVGAVFLA